MVNPLFYDKPIEVVEKLPQEPVYVQVDSLRIKQAFINLLSNAAKFTRDGVVTIYLETSAEEIIWGVRDTGRGIREEDLPLLFNPFQQISHEQVSTMKGTGLGLSLVREIITLHGGQVGVESSYGTGSNFFVRLPFQKQSKEAGGQPAVIPS